MSEELIGLFVSIGLKEQKAKETLKNATVTANLKKCIESAKKIKTPSPEDGVLLYHLASKIKPQVVQHVPLLVNWIVEKQLNTTQKIDAALTYLLGNAAGSIDLKSLKEACGVGVEISEKDIVKAVDEAIEVCKEELMEKRYKFNSGIIMQAVNSKLKWADGKCVKKVVDVQVADLLGPKTEEDFTPKVGGKNVIKVKILKSESKPIPKADKRNRVDDHEEAVTIYNVLSKVNFHNPGENYKTDGYVVTSNTMKRLEEHLKVTGGQVRTRFPPEPNGILHVGHAKAININFGYAAVNDGICFLRYDDTNPEKEEEKFFVGIRDMVEWLGYKPYKITHSSDYFDQLYDWAVILIKKGLAYVCHQKAEDIKGFNPPPSPWRDRPVEDNMQLFEDMKNGKIDEGRATLRMKVTLEEGKQDPVAYRIKFLPHHRTGGKWCIYPTYDYTHCLCDSIEHITHSLCTKEFQNRRSSYYWLCNALNIYCPVQWEYGRLNMNYTVVSKRKIAKLISENIVSDWDDPRLFTLTALRRRGFPPEAINSFCARMGVTGAQSVVDPAMLEASVRDSLNETAPRAMVVLDPLKLNVVEGGGAYKVTVPDFPGNPSKGSHQVHMDKVVYIDGSDFKENPEKGFRRLAPKQTVGLKHAGLVITLVDVVKNEEGNISELQVTVEPVNDKNKPKAFVQWVSDPVTVEVRLYDKLFIHKNPEDTAAVPDGFLSDINQNSLQVEAGYADKSLLYAKPFDKFQFERIGFFSVDPDSSSNALVFNRTVTLKEDSGKSQ